MRKFSDVVWHRALSFFRRKKGIYGRVYATPDGHAMIIDLLRYCKAFDSCVHPNEKITYAYEGRRDVAVRILRFLNLPSEQLAALMTTTAQPELDENG